MDKIQNDLVILFLGVLIFCFTYMVMVLYPYTMVVILLYVVATVSMVYGVFSILWELVLNARRR